MSQFGVGKGKEAALTEPRVSVMHRECACSSLQYWTIIVQGILRDVGDHGPLLLKIFMFHMRNTILMEEEKHLSYAGENVPYFWSQR
jgi:hypothetical protein